ncbi:MAG TPA: nuclear transport factor 2 family protein [Thermoanaerobaculia bacterium]|jgi:ketosteroid isomerase-like protein|nr:nuclear transport factor 2 family protein [Thermoanaerobaculia bacterium]
MRSTLALLLCLAFVPSLGATETPTSPTAAVEQVLDAFHAAAAKADEKTYFALFAPAGVFLGTDATERWDKTAFQAFAHPYFAKGTAWTFLPRNRHVDLSADGRVAWFDELLDSASYGECRGSGVLEKIDGAWKVQQYNLTIPLPNDLAKDVVAQIRAAKAAGTGTAPASVEDELVQLTQRRMDAVGLGDKAVWDEILAEDFTLTDEEGAISTKAEILDQLRPLPAGYSGQIRVAEPKVHVHGDVAVLTHLDREDEKVFDQALYSEYRTTDTFQKRDGKWRLIASQVLVIPRPRKVASVDGTTLDAYVGRYQLAPGVLYEVTREGDTLFGQRTGRAKEELSAASADTFFRKGTTRGEKVFARDPSGKVTELIDRRDNNDLVWKRVE